MPLCCRWQELRAQVFGRDTHRQQYGLLHISGRDEHTCSSRPSLWSHYCASLCCNSDGKVDDSRRAVIEHLRRASPGHCTASALSPPAAQMILSVLRVLTGRDGSGRGASKVAALRENSDYFRRGLLGLGCNVLGEWGSPVMVRSSLKGVLK